MTAPPVPDRTATMKRSYPHEGANADGTSRRPRTLCERLPRACISVRRQAKGALEQSPVSVMKRWSPIRGSPLARTTGPSPRQSALSPRASRRHRDRRTPANPHVPVNPTTPRLSLDQGWAKRLVSAWAAPGGRDDRSGKEAREPEGGRRTFSTCDWKPHVDFEPRPFRV